MTEEEVSSTIIVTTTNNNNKSPVDDNIVNQPLYIVKEKKKQSAFGFLKAASLKLRRRRSSVDLKQQKISLQQETVPPVDKKGENLMKLVGSMRPLHLQDNQSPPSPHELPPPMKSTSLPVDFSEHFSSPYSSSPSTSSVGTISQYASANNLHELYGDSNDNESEQEDPDHVFDSIGADDMIDAKAENFIAQFYEQMRRQQ